VLVPACIFLLPFSGWSGALTAGKPPDTGSLIPMLLGALLAAPVWVVVTALATGALTHAASHAYFGEGITIRGAWSEAWTRGWRYAGLYLVEVLLIWAAPIFVWFLLVSIGAGIAAVARNSGLGAAAGLLVGLTAAVLVAGLTAYGLWMLLRLALAFPACVVEQIGVGAALRRGPALCRGTKGRIFLLYLLGGVINYLLTLAIMLPTTIVLALFPGLQGAQHARTAAIVMFVALYGMAIGAQVLTKPVYAIAMVLFYFDQRIRQEGFDVEWMMMRAGLVVPEPPKPELQPWMAARADAGTSAAALRHEPSTAEAVLPAACPAEAAAAPGDAS
ncbi:MAG: hypothetical protein ACRD25_09090, partial [Terracidiphilus sp.]